MGKSGRGLLFSIFVWCEGRYERMREGEGNGEESEERERG